MTVRDGGDDDLPPEKRPSPSSLIDTVDSFQPVAQSLGGVQGAIFKGQLCRVAYRSKQGSALYPPRRAH